MKKALSILLILAAVTGLSSFAPVQTGGGVIKFEQDLIDFGSVQQNSEQIRTFTFTNTGTSPLVITDIKGQCGCTTILPNSWSKEPVAPGATASFKVKYDTVTRVGHFDKKIMVYCDASNAINGFVEVKIKGNVVPVGAPAPGN
jgi:hypothetical protein